MSEESRDIRKHLIEEAKGRLELLIVLGIFFPTLIYSFLKLTGVSDQDSNVTSLSWVFMIALYLLNYVFFELLKNKIDDRWVQWINGLSLAEIAIFVFPIGVLASAKSSALGFLTYFSFRTALYILQVIPVVTLIAIIIQFFQKIALACRLKKD